MKSHLVELLYKAVSHQLVLEINLQQATETVWLNPIVNLFTWKHWHGLNIFNYRVGSLQVLSIRICSGRTWKLIQKWKLMGFIYIIYFILHWVSSLVFFICLFVIFSVSYIYITTFFLCIGSNYHSQYTMYCNGNSVVIL